MKCQLQATLSSPLFSGDHGSNRYGQKESSVVSVVWGTFFSFSSPHCWPRLTAS